MPRGVTGCMTAEPEAKIRQISDVLDLEPHPEDGYFRESYRSSELIPETALSGRYEGERSHSTAIYFLLSEGTKSGIHRLHSDELWHFYLGGPLRLVQIFPDGRVEEVVLGSDVEAGHRLQHAVPRECWFGAYPEPGSSFSLVGCTVAPGFDFADFEMGEREQLLAEFPHARQIIEQLTDQPHYPHGHGR